MSQELIHFPLPGSLRQPGQLWGCRVAPPCVSRGATSSSRPTEVTEFVMGWLIPVLLHGHQPSVPQFPHLGSEAFGTRWSARPEQSNPCFHMGMAPEQPGAPGLP